MSPFFIGLIVLFIIAVAPPLLIRFVIARRPLRKGPAIGVAAALYFCQVVLVVLVDAEISPVFLTLIAFGAYFLLRAGGSRPPRHPEQVY